MPKEGFTVMAQYNHEILVNYLRDVYSLELLCCKIQGKVNYLNSEIHRGRQTISEFNHSSMPTLEVESVHDSRDLGASFSFIFLLLFGVALLLIPVIGIFLGTGVIGFTVFLMCGANKEDKDFEKSQNQKAQKNFEIRLSHYENLMKQARYYQSHLDSFTRSRDDSIIHLKTVKNYLAAAYGVNIIPNKYRDIYVAYYLYDYFSSSRETDLDKILQTMLLDQIVERLDRIIDQQEEIILNQRMAMALQEKQSEQLQQNHRAQLQAIARVEQNQQLQNDYLAMIDTNTRITNFFVTADYINKYL